MGEDECPAGVDRPAEESDLKEPMAEDPGGERGDVKAETVAMVTAAGSEAQTQTETETAPRSWKWSVIYLCIYGFMSALKPGEPFITPYLLSTEKNFTREQVTNEINPVLSYSYMVVLVPVLLLTDFLRYKPVLVVQGLSQVAIWLLLLLGSSLPHMQLMEFFYGMTMAARVAYSSYIFSLVTPGLYQRVASYSRTAVLMGVFFSSVLGQLCMSLGDMSYTTLSGVSLGFVSLGLLLSFCLPWPKRSMFFNRTHQRQQQRLRELAAGEGGRDTDATKAERDLMNPAGVKAPAAPAQPPWRWCTLSWRQSVFWQMLGEVRGVVRVPNLRLWCLWWVFNSTGYYLVLFYVHILWNKVYPATENKHVYNGGVEAVSVLLGAITSFLAGLVKIRWNLWSELLIGVITALQAGLLLLMGLTDNIWVCYVAYTLFRGFYQFLVPIAIFQIASSLTKELCALVFGINTFLGTIVKTIITLIVADKRGFGLDVHAQFLVYFFYFALLTVIYMVCAAVVITRHYRRQSGGGASALATPTELSPTAAVESRSDAELHSNGKPASA